MKKIMKLFVLVAAAAMALASCQKNEIDGPVKKEVHFTIKAGISDTKTTITDNGGTYTPSWTVGDMIGVMFELGDGEQKDTEFTAKTVEDGVATFEGKYTFATNDGGIVDGQLYAFYPSAAFNKSYSDGEVRLDLKAVQKPTSSSFDPSCDLLIAKPCDYIAEATGEQTEVVIDNMYFARMMSVLRINLKSEFLSNETVKSVSFNAEGMHLTGAMRFNLAEGTFKGNQTTSGNSEVKAEYSDDPVAVAGEKNSVYLVVAPVTIPSGTTLTFTIETENYDIVKTVTAPSEKVLPVGNVAVINLNIAEENCTAKTEDTSDYSGTYAILAKRTTGGYWYMTNDLGTASAKRFTAEEAGEALPEEGVTLGASKLWQVSKSGEYYTVKSVGANQYITWSSGNSADLGGVGIEFTIEKKEDGTYNLSYAASDETRYLSLNGTTGNNYFALYKSGQKADLSLIPAVQGEEPATLTATAPSQMSAEGGNGSFTYELKNPKDGVQLNATTEAAWITGVTVGDGEVTYTVAANESEEAREDVITLTYGDLTEDVTITQAGKPAGGGEPAEVATWSWTGGGKSAFDEDPNVVEIKGLGTDYAGSNAPYLIKLDTTGDYFIVKVDGAIQSVSVGVKMLGGSSTSYLDFQGSSDGSSYSSVQKHTISGATNAILELTTSNTFDASYRYIKFNFTKGSNVGVGPITITYIPDNEGGSGGEEPEPDPEEPETPETPVYASLAELVAAGAPTATGNEVTVTLDKEEIKSIYKSGNYRNGVYLNVGENDILIYCWNVPESWVEGGTISGTLTDCVWKLYDSIWELCPADWSDLTYEAPEGGSTEPEEPEQPGGGGNTEPTTKVVLSEEFDNSSTKDSSADLGSSILNTFPNFTDSYKAYKSKFGGLKFGNSSNAGYVTTKTLDLSKPFRVSLKVKGWTTVEGKIVITCGTQSKELAYTSTSAGNYEVVSAEFTAATSTSQVKIATSAKRAYIDDVVIEYID